jgi:putative membrane protein
MLTFFLRVAVNAAGIAFAAALIPGIALTGLGAALIAGLVFGLVNAIVKPVLVVLTLPITLLTLGLFIFVLNAVCFWLTSLLVTGFDVRGFWPAVFGSLFVSAISWLLNALIGPRTSR